VNRSSPIQYSSDKTFTQLLLGASTIFGLTTAGEIYGNGQGTSGPFGINSVVNRSSPVLMFGGPWIDFMPMQTGAIFMIKNNNTLWGAGAIGGSLSFTITSVSVSSPIQIDATKTWIKFPSLPFNQAAGVAAQAVEAGFPTPTPLIPSPTPSPSPSAISSCTGQCYYTSASDGSGGWLWQLDGSDCSSGCGCVTPAIPPTGPFEAIDVPCV